MPFIKKFFRVDRKVDVQGLTGTGIIIDAVLVQEEGLPEDSTEGVVFFCFIPKGENKKVTTTISFVELVQKYQCANGSSEIVWLKLEDPKPQLAWSDEVLFTITKMPSCFSY
jgi:hypothetical protein